MYTKICKANLRPTSSIRMLDRCGGRTSKALTANRVSQQIGDDRTPIFRRPWANRLRTGESRIERGTPARFAIANSGARADALRPRTDSLLHREYPLRGLDPRPTRIVILGDLNGNAMRSFNALPAIGASSLDDKRILHVAAQFAPDAFGLQETLDGFRAVQAAEAAVLEAAEWRVKGHRAIGVDPDRSSLQFPRHQVTTADVAGPHAGRKAERRAVCQFQHIFFCFERRDAQHR